MTEFDLLKKKEMWQEDCPGVLQTAAILANVFIAQNNHFGKVLQKNVFMLGEKDYMYEITPLQEKKDIFNNVREKGFEFLSKLNKEWEGKLDYLTEIESNVFNKKFADLSDEAFAKSYKDFVSYSIDLWSYTIICESGDHFGTYELEKYVLENSNVPKNKVREVMMIMCSMDSLSFLDEENLQLLRLTNEKDKVLDEGIDEYIKNFYWIKTNYKGIERVKRDVVKREMGELRDKYSADEISKRINSLVVKVKQTVALKKKILGKYKFRAECNSLFKIYALFSEWIDKRKVMVNRIFYILFNYLEEVSLRFKIEPKLSKFFMPEEIIQFLLTHEKPDKKVLERRQDCFALHIDSKFEWQILDNKFARKEMINYFKKELSGDLKGVVASTGKGAIKGICYIIKDVNMDKFKEGGILVASMTRPEFLPLMRQASAIVTDEGGLTCHAAIVARELKIPCIIGCRKATLVLKTGDEIKVDVQQGQVEKLS